MDQRKASEVSPGGSLTQPPERDTNCSSPGSLLSTHLEQCSGPHLAVSDVTAEQFEVRHGLWPLPWAALRWESQ